MHFYDDPAHREDAIFWLKQAAEADYEPAYFFLGVLQLKSDTSEVIREGIQWLEKASPNVGGRAEFNLSQLYLDGKKVEQDYEKAWHWANLSKELGCEFGALYVALILFDSDSGHYDPKLGMQFATELADTGLHNAMALIANAHERGLGVPVNLELALDWYVRAAEAGSDDCARILGFKYFQGDGVVESRAQAVKWLTPIAQAGDLRSMCCLMMAHGEDKEIPEDMVLAYTYVALAGPYVEGLQKEMVEMLEPDFKKQISEAQLKRAKIQADEWRSHEGFLPH
jgi:TPR repeat protein